MRIPFVLLAGLAFFESCCFCDNTDRGETLEQQPVYRFAVAGHVYGNPHSYQGTLYPSFLKKLKEQHTLNPYDKLFLTGDVVWGDSIDAKWKYCELQLDSLNIDWVVAPGNHDKEISRFSLDEKISSIDTNNFKPIVYVVRKNAFVVLNTTNPGWTLSDKDRIILTEKTKGFDTLKNIFVFTHQLWWIRNAPDKYCLDSLRSNSFVDFEGPGDFWKDVFPVFEQTNVQTWFFAGDMGAWSVLPAYYEDHYGRFHFFGSGMGGGIMDNYLSVSVYQNGRVDIKKIRF
ncbi:MAG: metallophosphoesterase [Crocinitomicaceae bacterium]|nr:metallophosphoesterase [Crocinitomicaceae bacterium]